MVIFAPDEPSARVALRELEAELRAMQLNLQPGKTEVIVGAANIKEKIIDADNEVGAWRGCIGGQVGNGAAQ